METFFITLIIAIVAVGGMVLGLSITLIRKGRHMQNDVGDNDDMKKRGIECTAAMIRREEAILRGEEPDLSAGCGKGVCADCAVDEACDEKNDKRHSEKSSEIKQL